uniref:Nlg1 n=1 Tax=Dendrocoelum lacteum TaxID=27895 RepID=T1D134_9PLAT
MMHFVIFCFLSLQFSDAYNYFQNNPMTPSQKKNSMDPFHPDDNSYNTKHLKAIMGGKNYDVTWMSINRPPKIFESANFSKPPSRNLLMLSNFKNYTLVDEVGNEMKIPKNISTAIRRWIVEQASCRVEYVWKKLDALHWPSWIKHGICSSKESCSWPPGMSCRNESHKKFKILKWICNSDPFAHKWNEFREKFLQLRKSRLLNRKRRHNLKKSNLVKQRRGLNFPNRSKRDEKKRLRYAYKTSKYVQGFFCQWEPVDYSVVETCMCSCQ